MKNIFVLPTDKPSRLLQCLKVIELLDKKWLSPIGKVNRNIYITDDSEIKVGDWSYDSRGFVEKVDESYDLEVINALGKKIILTTDPQLIADGVQSIDDEFLQWFIKNSSCEKVEVELIDTFKKTNEVYVDEITGGNYYEIIKKYKIIIPKEETKPVWKQIIEDCGGEEAFMEAAGLKPKQETLEELAKNTTKKYINEREKQTAYLEFINGYQLAKEQDAKMYSEEEVRKLLIMQRGNSYVAILTKTKDEELARIASTAPEPGGKDGWVKQFKNK
jgi:hypothetical protein